MERNTRIQLHPAAQDFFDDIDADYPSQ